MTWIPICSGILASSSSSVFVLRFNPLLVVTVAALRDRLRRRARFRRGASPRSARRSTTTRYVSVVWIVLPVIGLLERYGLQQRARTLISGG
jgi:uncharacterized membrane protein